MSAPDPDSYGLLGKVVAAGAALVVPMWGAWNWLSGALGKKLDKSDFKDFCERFDEHVKNDREVQAKLFDQARENEQRAQDRYERLMERLSK